MSAGSRIAALLRYPWEQAGPLVETLVKQGVGHDLIDAAIVRRPEPRFLAPLVRRAADPARGTSLRPSLRRALQAYGARAAGPLHLALRRATTATARQRLLDAVEAIPGAGLPPDLLERTLRDPLLAAQACRLALRERLRPGLPVLRWMLAHPHPRLRAAAARLARQIGGPELDELLRRLRETDPRPCVRRAVAR